MKKRFYITTPIYYPSGNLHLGHAYTTVLADIFARYKRMQGYEVFFSTGSDEHGQKIAKKAAEKHQEPLVYVSEIIKNFELLWQKLNISHSFFIRTTMEKHITTVQKVFARLFAQDELYLGTYDGAYCLSCEEFITASQVDTANNKCLVCLQEVKTFAEETYFWKLKAKKAWLLDYFAQHEAFIVPENRKKEMIKNFIAPGLYDLSVSRKNLAWSIPILQTDHHGAYVWIDALLNYLSVLNYLQPDDTLFQKFWNNPEVEICQLIGKEITRFHTIYWPVLLESLGLRKPDRIISHGWIVDESGKMSKSKGNVINPLILIDRYGCDVVRYYLAAEIPFLMDGKYSHQHFLQTYNTFFANDLGNLVRRINTMTLKYCQNLIPSYNEPAASTTQKTFFAVINEITTDYIRHMDAFQLDQAITAIQKLSDLMNKFIEQEKPWTLTTTPTTLQNILYLLNYGLIVLATLTKPIIPDTATKIYRQLGITTTLHFLNQPEWRNISAKQCEPPTTLFPRIELEPEVAALAQIF